MQKSSYYIINGITFYRLLAAPLLLVLIVLHRQDIFKWLLAVSFFTDAIDGYLARRYKVTSVAGAKLDSIADDLTIAMAIIGVFVFKPEFIRHEWVFVLLLLVLYVTQTVLALIRYGKISSFHTYSAKTAAILQGIFLLTLFFFPEPLYTLFYIAAIATVVDLVEEIILVLMLPTWETDVKGLYHVIRRNRRQEFHRGKMTDNDQENR